VATVIEVGIDGGSSASGDGTFARFASFGAGSDLEDRLLAISLHAGRSETGEFTDPQSAVSEGLDDGDVAGWPRRAQLGWWGSGGDEQPRDVVCPERENLA
jgi:hypothetical protein